MQTPVHIINHTHWDREWFLTHEYTTEWIPALVDNLRELAHADGSYEYLFDGQTLVIEDLLATRPEYRSIVEELVAKHHLRIGPLYSQPDWRLLSGELLVRNIVYGSRDASELGGPADVAWLVDTFGHLSQTPQMLAAVGIDAAYVWRGVPEMVPAFNWRSPNGTSIVTVNLFGGYRNLYGISRTADIAVHRLAAEVEKLSPFYGDTPIPLFDGYDLDTEPENPIAIYAESGDLPAHLELRASSPRRYLDDLLDRCDGPLPDITGELLSGRYGSVFPGSLSSRTYLKVLHYDAEIALLRRAEPLATLAHARGAEFPSAEFERASRELLQNGVHDCICGVSIDQVHERMDRSYRSLIAAMNESSKRSIARALGGWTPGVYAVSTSSAPMRTTRRWGERVAAIESDAIGVAPIGETHAIERASKPVPSFRWVNAHYEADIDGTGIRFNGRPLGELVVRAEAGDTYSSEPGAELGRCAIVAGPILESASPLDAEIRLDVSLRHGDVAVDATVRVRFDDGPMVELTIELDSTGTDFRVDLDVSTGIECSKVLAAMPFDAVERPHRDTHLLGDRIEPELAAVLMGQREVDEVDEFPFHDFVAFRASDRAVSVMAAGIRCYTSHPDGRVTLPLRRSVEWLARTGLERRSGDAGPAMYVPGARCERRETHRVAIAWFATSPTTTELFAVADAFHTPPLIVEVGDGGDDGHTNWRALECSLPITNLRVGTHGPTVRSFHPESTTVSVASGRWTRVSARGADLGEADEIAPFTIVELARDLADVPTTAAGDARVVVHGLPGGRVGTDRSRPDDRKMERLQLRRDELALELRQNETAISTSSGDESHRLRHLRHVLAREIAELDLSLELNRRRSASDEIVSIPDDIDPEIARLGLELNDERIMRRIYDYVVQSLDG